MLKHFHDDEDCLVSQVDVNMKDVYKAMMTMMLMMMMMMMMMMMTIVKVRVMKDVYLANLMRNNNGSENSLVDCPIVIRFRQEN